MQNPAECQPYANISVIRKEKRIHLVYTCVIQHMIYSVYFYIYRPDQSVKGQNYGLDNKRTDVGFVAEKEILVFSAPTAWDMELIQPPT